MKGKAVLAITFSLLLVGISPSVSNIQLIEAEFKGMGLPEPEIGIAEYDYYFVAGHQMTPTLPPPAPQPPGFQFTCNPTGYNMGKIQYNGGRNYLYEGVAEAAPAKDTNAYVVMNITNLLGYEITVLDLTAEVTYGTGMKRWWFDIGGVWMGNMTLVAVDTLDPWDQTAPIPPLPWDEVDYNLGTVNVHRDFHGIVRGYPDWYRCATGIQGHPYPPTQLGPATLLENDPGGDALSTGHVTTKYGGTPITLAPSATFTEYFGITLFGVVDPGTQIDATITLRLNYLPPPEGTTRICDVYVADFYPCFPYNQLTDEGFSSWEYLWLNCTVWNWGNVPINVTVNIYVSYRQFHRGEPISGWRLIYLGSQNLSIPVCDRTKLSLMWNVRASGIGQSWSFIKANATATSGNLTASDDGFICQFKSRVTGDADGDDDNDTGDQRKVQLAMFTHYPEQGYLIWNWYPVFTDIDADGDVDVGDQRKTQFHCFETW